MASKDSLETRKLLMKGIVVEKNTDAPVAIRLRYLGTGSVTSVTVVTATGVTMVTSAGGTDAYVYGAGAGEVATMGALVDAINKDGIFEAKILDVLRSAACDDALLACALTTTTLDEEGNEVYDLVVDTSGMFYVGVCLSAARSFGQTSAGHRVHLQEVTYVANMGTVATAPLTVTARKGAVERVVAEILSVDTTATTVNFASGVGYISTEDGEELIISIKDGASMADGAYMRVVGKIE